MKSVLKITIHVLKLLQKNFDSFSSKSNAKEHFEICVLKLIKKLISRQLMTNCFEILYTFFLNFSIKITKPWQSI